MWPRPKMNDALDRIQRDYYTRGPPPHDSPPIEFEITYKVIDCTKWPATRIIWKCSEGHEHRWRWSAWLCGRWQTFKIKFRIGGL